MGTVGLLRAHIYESSEPGLYDVQLVNSYPVLQLQEAVNKEAASASVQSLPNRLSIRPLEKESLFCALSIFEEHQLPDRKLSVICSRTPKKGGIWVFCLCRLY
jgi:hypothetical protein